jgi:hypothetical protein
MQHALVGYQTLIIKVMDGLSLVNERQAVQANAQAEILRQMDKRQAEIDKRQDERDKHLVEVMRQMLEERKKKSLWQRIFG